MHEWHTEISKNPLDIINQFLGYHYDTDYSGAQVVSAVRISGKVFSTYEEAVNYVTGTSYGGNTAYLATYTSKKLSKTYQSAYDNFITKYKDYISFKNNLTIAYGRTASKTTCPNCGSSINLKYGNKFKACPVCGSNKIISDSNWKTLASKHRICEKAAENLEKEAEKNNVTFVCGIEWHC